MKTKTEKTRRLRRLKFFFIFAVFGILSGTLGLLVGTLYILMNAGIIHIEIVTIPAWFLILILILSSIILGVTISILLSKHVIKTADTIAKGMMELAKGNFDTRINLGENQESKQLAESFNKLAEELQNIKVLRSDFINEFAHEFKTPIVSLKGFAELLSAGNLTEEQKKEYIDIILQESRRLSSLSTNLLELSKVEKQKILTDVTEFNVSEQIRSCVLLLEKKWSEKDMNLILDFEEFKILANEDLLKQVWINLIDNAIKFSYDSGLLEIIIEQQQSGIVVSIKNQGKPLKEEDYEKVFEKFYRADDASEGNGVGLAIVKNAVDLHGGVVRAYNQVGYTVFSVYLPKGEKMINN